MNKSLKLLAMSAGLAACGFASQASAYVYADSRLLISNLNIIPVGSTSIAVRNYLFTVSDTAALNGSPLTGNTANCGGTLTATNCGTNPVLVPGAANAAGSGYTRGSADFSFGGPTAGFQFSNSNARINTSELIPSGLSGPATTSTSQIAESQLISGASASANSNIQSITSVQYSFTTGTGGSIALNFNANMDLFAQIAEMTGGIYNAQASLSATFTISQDGGAGFARWAPNGLLDNGCTAVGGLTCVETADGSNLNATVGVSANGTSSGISHGVETFDPFGITLSGLLANTTYTITLASTSQTQLSRTAVPEPGTLALLSVGIAALGLRARRQKKQAA